MNAIFILKLLALLGCGLIAGVFFAFSTFIMRALSRRPTTEGIAAMQEINITVINPWFMTVFLGTGLVCLVLIATVLLKWQQSGTTDIPLAQPALSTIASLLYSHLASKHSY